MAALLKDFLKDISDKKIQVKLFQRLDLIFLVN